MAGAATSWGVTITSLYGGFHGVVDPTTGSSYFMFADVNTCSSGDTAVSSYALAWSGYIFFGVSRQENGWHCAIYPDDVPEADSFLVPFAGTFCFDVPSIYPDYARTYTVTSTSTGFTVKAGRLPGHTVPDITMTGLLLAPVLVGFWACRRRWRLGS